LPTGITCASTFAARTRSARKDLIAGALGTRGWIRVSADKLHGTGLQVVTVRKKRGVDTHVYSGSADVWLPVGGVIALVVLIWGGLAFTRPSTTAGRDLQGQAAARADEDACAAEIQKLRAAAAEATPKPAPQRP
jgi:hypothetical protein